jgi:hypothetical protein
LKRIDASTDPSLDLHLIADNYCMHKHWKVQRWLTRHPRFHKHFIPMRTRSMSSIRLRIVTTVWPRPGLRSWAC